MNNKRIIRFIAVIAFLASITAGATKSFAVDPAKVVVAPFWQHVGQVYTFVAITHPSLSGMTSQIGVKVTAFLADGSATSLYGSATNLTVSAGNTSKIFVFGTNSSQSLLSTANFPNDTIILGTNVDSSGGATGYIQFEPTGSEDITELSYWGAVVFAGTNTGFAMEFIGDLQDSASAPNHDAARSASGVN